MKSGRLLLTCWLVAMIAPITPFSLVQAGEPPEDRTHAEQIDRARELLAMLRDGQYLEFEAAQNDIMRQKMNADVLRQIWAAVESNAGVYEKEINVTTATMKDMVVVDLVSQFASAVLNIRITLDAKGQVAGLYFLPGAADKDYLVPSYVNTAGFVEEEFVVSSGEYKLPGTLTIPKGDGPFPAVVLVHGSGPHDQDETIHGNKPFKDLAWGLATRGIVVARYEKRTHKYGQSMDPKKITIEEETVEDAVSAARQVMKHRAVDGQRVYIAGHSLGATAAPYIGHRESRLAGLILLAAAARPIYELVDDQVTYIAESDGRVSSEERQQIEEVRRMVQALRRNEAKPGDTLLGAPIEYWRTLERMKPLRFAREWDKPMLILQGGRDYQVDVKKDFGVWKSTLAGRTKVNLRVFDNLNHLFHAGSGPSKPEEYKQPGSVDARVIAYIADWIKQQS